ncbi:transposase-like protein [Metarhizium brunneum]
MSLHAFWGPSRALAAGSLSAASSSRQSADLREPLLPNEQKSNLLDQHLHRSTCPPHSLSFPINWGVLRRHDGTILKDIQYRIRRKRSVGRRVKVSWIYSHGAELEHSNDKVDDGRNPAPYGVPQDKKPSNSTDDDDDTDTNNAAEVFQLAMPFNEDEYKKKLIDWAIKLRLSYREVTDEATCDLLT